MECRTGHTKKKGLFYDALNTMDHVCFGTIVKSDDQRVLNKAALIKAATQLIVEYVLSTKMRCLVDELHCYCWCLSRWEFIHINQKWMNWMNFKIPNSVSEFESDWLGDNWWLTVRQTDKQPWFVQSCEIPFFCIKTKHKAVLLWPSPVYIRQIPNSHISSLFHVIALRSANPGLSTQSNLRPCQREIANLQWFLTWLCFDWLTWEFRIVFITIRIRNQKLFLQVAACVCVCIGWGFNCMWWYLLQLLVTGVRTVRCNYLC